MPIIRKIKSKLIVLLLKKKNSDHKVSVLAITNPIQERYLYANTACLLIIVKKKTSGQEIKK